MQLPRARINTVVPLIVQATCRVLVNNALVDVAVVVLLLLLLLLLRLLLLVLLLISQ